MHACPRARTCTEVPARALAVAIVQLKRPASYIVMAHIVMTYIAMACLVVAYIVRAYIVVAYDVGMACL